MRSYEIPSIINKFDWLHSLDHGLVRVRKHPTQDLLIANYTDRATFKQDWNSATRNARGLIFDFDGNIVARPFPKFFNYGDNERPSLPMDSPIRVMDKMDGSLGIIYSTAEGIAVATRGSFESEQALHATEVLNTRYADFKAVSGVTYLVEIVYPENRVVVDYEGLDDLVLLDVIDNRTGASVFEEHASGWPGPVVDSVYAGTFADVLNAPQDANKEGFVVLFERTQDRVKIKFDEYLRLHRLRFGFTNLKIWEQMRAGWDIEEILEGVADEFHDEIREVYRDLAIAYEKDLITITETFWEIYRQVDWLNTELTLAKKEFAALVEDEEQCPRELRGAMYVELNSRRNAYERIRPDFKPMFTMYPGEEN